jgi:NitT/TauT family transport system ATP-binding protein
VRQEPFISFADVQKSFKVDGRQFVAVRNVSLEIQRGEIITLVGPSGCGKSTLLNMTAGLFGPTEGRVHYDGAEVKGVNTRVGYMTQADHLLPWRTVAGNIAVPLQIRRLGKREIDMRVEELLALVGLTGFGTSYPNQLSGGMRKRAAMARLLASDPETLLMDEPFGALDAQMRLTLQTELLRLCKKLKKTVLFVTHDVDEAIALADRCVVFAGRPGTIDHILEVSLAQPRNLVQLRSDPRYVELCAALWQRLAPDIAGAAVPSSLAHSLEAL